MAALRAGLSLLTNLIHQTGKRATLEFQQVRHQYGNRWMKRDDKRRQLAKKYAQERLCMVALKRNDILPNEIRTEISESFDKLIPRQTALRQLTARCIITGRGRGTVYNYRVSRIMFRHFADYNLLSGVQRGIW